MQLLFLDVLQWMYHYDTKTGSSKQVLYEMTELQGWKAKQHLFTTYWHFRTIWQYLSAAMGDWIVKPLCKAQI